MSLELISISRRFGRDVALDGIDMHVRSGDCYGFIGHNGAGKTTTMRIALGLQRPDEGRVLIDGFDARRFPREARARMAGLIETPGFHGHKSGFANLVELARLQGYSRDEARRQAAVQISRVGLDHAANRRVQHYSQGMRQRLGIAQALIGRPAYVLLDEPTNGLDPEGIADVRALVQKLVREDGLTVLVSSHQLHELTGLCNRIAVLQRGRLLIEEETEKLLVHGDSRYRLATPDAVTARDALSRLSIPMEPRADGVYELELCKEDAPRIASELVRAGVRLTSFAPESVTLEEIYLRLAQGEPVGRAAAIAADSSRGDRAERHVRGVERSASPLERAAGSASTSSRGSTTSPARNTDDSSNTSNVGGTSNVRNVTRAHSVSNISNGAPPVLRAPARPLVRLFGYEVRRLSARAGVAILLVLPALLAVAAVVWRAKQARADAQEVAGAKLFSATAVTAFEGVGIAIQSALPLLTFIALGIASQSISSELAGGTLRNVVLRPVLRRQVVIGKALASVCAVLCGYVVVALAALIAARACFEFADVAEILPNGARFALVPAKELWPALWSALLAPILPLCAYTTLGLLAGTIARSAAGGLALALFCGVGLDLSRAVARAFALEGSLLSAYLPSPLGDTSAIRAFVEMTQGISNTRFDYEHTAYVVPVAWLAVSLLLAIVLLARRSIP